MFKRKLSLVEKIILIGVVVFGLFIIGFQFTMKRENKNFYLPDNFSGWVMIEYNVPNVPLLPQKEGAYQITVPDSGKIKTSSPLVDGWGRDLFFTKDGKQIPNTESVNNDIVTRFHLREYCFRSFKQAIPLMKDNSDTTFYEGTTIHKISNTQYVYREGKKSVEVFYVSDKAQSTRFDRFQPPVNPDTALLYETAFKKKLTSER